MGRHAGGSPTVRTRTLGIALALIALALMSFAGSALARPATSARVLGPKHRLGPNGTAVSLVRSAARPYFACPMGACEAIATPGAVRQRGSHGFSLPHSSRLLEGSGELGGYDPQDLQSAYDIPTTGGSGITVAVVDAFGYPAAESDLAKYRSKYGLAACTKASGCFKKVNQVGEEGKYPVAKEKLQEEGWQEESALDLDMVSAACPQCKILLVEANGELPAETGASVDTAVSLGAQVVSNSYGYPEDYAEWCGSTGCTAYTSHYHHPGVEVVASSGDAGYDNMYFGLEAPSFPAASPDVIAVGGTALHKSKTSRGWSETAWGEPSRESGSGSGCSGWQTKPAWQTDSGCSKRMENDVAAVAACETPVSVYVTAAGGWEDFCGTSASSPLVGGILAHLSESERSLGADAFYTDPASLFDDTIGTDGTCTGSPEYFCAARAGYDGPTGLGTPDELPGVVVPTVTAVEPPSGPSGGGTNVTIRGAGFANATAVKFGGTSVSFTINTGGSITAAAPGGKGVVDVTVATTAGTSATSSADHFTYLEGPEFGRCIKVATGTGRFSGSTCISSTAKNSYEWFPAFGGSRPLEKTHFTSVAKTLTKVKLETAAKDIVTCTGEHGSGEYSGNTTVANVTYTFTGCALGTKGACTSPGKAEGEISTVALSGTLGVVAKGLEAAKNKIGVALKPASGEQVTEFGCPGTHGVVDGSVIGELPRDTMVTVANVKFTEAKAVQKPTHFEGGSEQVLKAFFGEDGPFEPAGLLFTEVQTSEEKVEVNAVL
jgi:hypothetical protein